MKKDKHNDNKKHHQNENKENKGHLDPRSPSPYRHDTPIIPKSSPKAGEVSSKEEFPKSPHPNPKKKKHK